MDKEKEIIKKLKQLADLIKEHNYVLPHKKACVQIQLSTTMLSYPKLPKRL